MADSGRRCLDAGRRILPLLGISLLLGAPQVLALPMPYASDGLSLSLSSILPVISLAGLLGLGASAMGDGARLRRAASIAGAVSVVIYLVLAWTVTLGWSWTGDVAPGVAIAFVMSAAGALAVAVGMFSCCYMAVGSDEGDCVGHSARFCSAGFALASASLLGFAGRVLPNWTAMRVAASSASPDGRLFVESIALGSLGSGQGPYPLAAGVSAIAPALGASCVAWVVLLAVAAPRPRVSVRGICSGLFAAWALCALFPGVGRALVWNGGVPVFLLVLAVVLLVASRALDRLEAKKALDGKADIPCMSVLSPREGEALRLRMEGLSSSKTAERMGVSPSTVRNLQARALDKLGVESLGELQAGERRDATFPPEGDVRIAGDMPFALLLAGLILAVVVAMTRSARPWSAMNSEVMVLGLSLAFCFLLKRSTRGGRAPCAWYEIMTCVFVGFLAGLLPLVPLVVVLLLLSAFASGALDRFKVSSDCFACGGFGVCLGGYAAGLLPRLPALLSLTDNDEGAMAFAMLAGLAAGVFCLASAASCWLTARSAADRHVAAAEKLDRGEGPKRFLAYLVSRGLGDTEASVAVLVLRGKSGAEICSELSLSKGAVNSARRGAYRKLGIHSRAKLVSLYESTIAPRVV